MVNHVHFFAINFIIVGSNLSKYTISRVSTLTIPTLRSGFQLTTHYSQLTTDYSLFTTDN